MRKIIYSCFLSACVLFSAVDGTEIYPRYTLKTVSDFPINFRTSRTPYREGTNSNLTRDGLDNLRMSGSGQYSEEGFKALQSMIETRKLVILDLRGEYHGFLNGSNVYWKAVGNSPYAYLYGLSTEEIEAREWSSLLDLLGEQVVELDTDQLGPINFPVRDVQTERQLVQSKGYHYYRINFSFSTSSKVAHV